ncbi:hypothetical protein BT67DRAFT_230957 [Trichocladium antarcticum]|uniref:Uncharacterized protein n=1 Tax=Trichocladium antarcticum TaxID=1450529 RepID=A0AAN6UN30_9PEZI|nr:hypothetical protein BT67DRAFT_230957 [Trichocladium antarcticum]
MSHRTRALTHPPTAPKTALSGNPPLHVSRASQLRRVPLLSFLPSYPGTPPPRPPLSFLFSTSDGEAGFRGCNYGWSPRHIFHFTPLHIPLRQLHCVATVAHNEQQGRDHGVLSTAGTHPPSAPPPRSSGHGILPMLLAGLLTPCSILSAWTDGPRKLCHVCLTVDMF